MKSKELKQNWKEGSPSRSELKWSHLSSAGFLPAPADWNSLSSLKNIVLDLRRTWSSQALRENGWDGKESEKRLLLLESEIEGLLKRRIDYTVRDSNGGERVLDYSTLLTQKENQVDSLTRQVSSLEEKLRRANKREVELEARLAQMGEEIRRKEELIALKHNSAVAELAVSTVYRDAFARLRRNVELNRYKVAESERLIFDGVSIPEVAEVGNIDIRAETFTSGAGLANRSRVIQQMPDLQKYRVKLVQFFREFERLGSQQQGFTDFQVERILEGFLSTMNETKLYEKMQLSLQNYRNSQEYLRIKENFAVAAGLYAELLASLKGNSSIQLPLAAENIFELLQREKVVAAQVQSGAVFVNLADSSAARIVEVSVQDEKSKQLIHVLAHEMKRLFLKFPKLQGEIDPTLVDFLQQEVLDVLESESMEKLIQIVKYVPQLIKVDHVYTHLNDKDRKIEFHLRVLIKTLLDELFRLKTQTGVALEIDESLISMINTEIKDIVNVDDILRVFAVIPRIVEVEKIVEKVVERVVEVPKVITVEKIVEKIVEVEKIREVEKIVNVPIETPLIVHTERERLVPVQTRVETVVEVPTVVEKLVEMQREVSKIMEVEVFRDKIVEVDRPIEVERTYNHIQTEYQQVEVITQKIVPVESVIEKIVEVPVYVEKIVERIVEVPKIVEVERIVEKIVPVVEYRNAREVENHIEVKYQIVDRIVEKIVVVPQIKERIKEVPQMIEVIKTVTNVVTEIREVEVIREKIVIQERIKEVEKIITQVVEVPKEVIRQVQRFVEVPIIREVLVIKQLLVEKPVISRVESVHIKQVIVKEPIIVNKVELREVDRFINVYIEVPKVVKCIEERIVEVPVIKDRIKEVPVIVEKIIEKMVEVPKVVEVERIVEKIVVVPRVVEKVIEVPQIVEKIIEKEVIREVIRFIEKEVQVPVIKEVIKEVEVIKNIYIEVEKVVDRLVEKAVRVPEVQQRLLTTECIREVPLIQREQVVREIYVEKIVPQIIESVQLVEVQRQIIVPVEIPVPVNLIEEKVVQVRETTERIIPVPQIIQKLVPIKEEVIQMVQIEKIVERILIEKSIEEVEKIVPYIQEVIKEVPTIVEKLVMVETKVEQIVIAQQIIEKVIEKINIVPQIYEVERIREKLVEVPKLIEIERVVPQIMRVNHYIQKIAEKIVEVPTIIETLKEVVREQERIVPVNTTTTEIVEVERQVQKLVYSEKLKEVVRNVNYIEKVLQIIDRIEQVPFLITTSEEKFIEVPYILEKIVEKIIVMPQIVEVLKYVHEVTEIESAGVAVDVEVGVHEARYKQITKSVDLQLGAVLRELKGVKGDASLKKTIEVVEKFLLELRQFILVPRIVKIVEEKIVEKEVSVDRVVELHSQDEAAIRKELSLSILVQKLISELKRLKKSTGAGLQLDDDIKLIFFADLDVQPASTPQMQAKLNDYCGFVQKQFEALGNWTMNHQFMLNTFLQERFLMAELIDNAQRDIENAHNANAEQLQGFQRLKEEAAAYVGLLEGIRRVVAENKPVGEIVAYVEQFDLLRNNLKQMAVGGIQTHMQVLGDLNIQDERIDALLRQKDSQIGLLKEKLFQSERKTQSRVQSQQNESVLALQADIDQLRKQNYALLTKNSQLGLLGSLKVQVSDLQARNSELEQQISNLKTERYNQDSQIKLLMQNISFKKDNRSAAEIEQIPFGQTQSAIYNQGNVTLDTQGPIGSLSKALFTSQASIPSAEKALAGSGVRQQGEEGRGRLGSGSGPGFGTYNTRLTESRTYKQPIGQQGQSGVKPTQSIQYSSFGIQDMPIPYGSSSGVSELSARGSQMAQTTNLSNYGQGSEVRSNLGQSGVSQQGANIYTAQLSSAERVPLGYTVGQGDYSSVRKSQLNLQNLPTAAKDTPPQSSRVDPQLPTYTYYQPGLLSGSQLTASKLASGQKTSQFTVQDSKLRTPIESYKFNTPSPAATKMTESIIKRGEEQRAEESPATFKKEEAPRSNYRYYSGADKKE